MRVTTATQLESPVESRCTSQVDPKRTSGRQPACEGEPKRRAADREPHWLRRDEKRAAPKRRRVRTAERNDVIGNDREDERVRDGEEPERPPFGDKR